MTEFNFRYYTFSFRHSNHTTFKGKIKAISDENLLAQLEGLLYNRYRRNQDASKAVVVEVSKEEFDVI